jgi:hypothetical protein
MVERVCTVHLIAALFLLSSCSKNENPTSTENETGTLVLRMTDSPASYDSVIIQVDSVRVHVSDSDTLHSGWYTLNRIPARYDLLTLANGADTIIGTARLPAGRYSQIRLFIGTGSHVVVNGVSHPLTIPSGSQSGLKLKVNATIQPNITYTQLLDFDAARSIVRTGNGNYMLKPVIRVITTPQTGSISGIVLPASARAVVTAANATDTVSAFADASGFYRLSYLPPTSYTVSFVPTDTTYQVFTVAGVFVFPGQTTSLGTITLLPR